jgi:hypothetical protein
MLKPGQAKNKAMQGPHKSPRDKGQTDGGPLSPNPIVVKAILEMRGDRSTPPYPITCPVCETEKVGFGPDIAAPDHFVVFQCPKCGVFRIDRETGIVSRM